MNKQQLEQVIFLLEKRKTLLHAKNDYLGIVDVTPNDPISTKLGQVLNRLNDKRMQNFFCSAEEEQLLGMLIQFIHRRARATQVHIDNINLQLLEV